MKKQCEIVSVENVTEKLKKLFVESGKTFDIPLIDKAINLATKAHNGQFRSSGEEFVCHPLEVAAILVELGMDSETIVAAVLHDVIEDTDVTLKMLEKEFGKETAELVDGVTKLGNLPFSSKEEEQAENIRKMLLAMAEDIRVIIIKLADRLHNMRTISCRPRINQLDNAKETMEIFAPLAHRLGIRSIKDELEDLSLQILDEVAYEEIETALALHDGERTEFITGIKEEIEHKLESEQIKSAVSARVKSIVGIFKKVYIQGRSFDEIYDIYAVRIIVDNDLDCYNVLGIIHDMFRPLPNRFKDYISTPKANMYQSLHTTVISNKKIPFEVQIRTWEMHYTAEYGIAAHWKYKVGSKAKTSKLEERLSWIRQFIDNQKDVDDAADIIHSIKTDLSSDEVYVFTPRGDVMTLPVGATAIDFAYSIHSEVGNKMVGAKVDGRIVPIDYEVKNGEIVEVILSNAAGQGPSRDWLSIVKTGEARNKIRTWFKRERREENVEQGREDFLRQLDKYGVHIPDDELQDFVLMQAKKQHVQKIDDFYAAIGYGGIVLLRIMPRIKEEYSREMKAQNIDIETVLKNQKHKKTVSNGGVIVENIGGALVKFSRCCNPVPGDSIVGFITRGYGVSIHKNDCVNVPKDLAAAPEAERWVSVYWEDNIREDFKATLVVEANNRHAILADITSQLATMHVMISAINAKEPENGRALMSITVDVKSLEHLDLIKSRLMKIDDVISVKRSVSNTH